MNLETAKLVVIAIASIGGLAWLAGFATMLGASRELRERAGKAGELFEMIEPARPGTIVGEIEIEGRPEPLSEKLARVLARDGMGPLGPVRIVSRDAHQVVFESAGEVRWAPGGFRGGSVRLTADGARTRLAYRLEAASGRVLLAMGWLFVVLGLVALVGGVALLMTLVVPSPNPGVRGQAFQMVQAVHFLWPPFLFARLANQPARLIRDRVESLLHNLPYA